MPRPEYHEFGHDTKEDVTRLARQMLDDLTSSDTGISAAHACAIRNLPWPAELKHLTEHPEAVVTGAGYAEAVENFFNSPGHPIRYTIVEDSPLYDLYWAYMNSFYLKVVAELNQLLQPHYA